MGLKDELNSISAAETAQRERVRVEQLRRQVEWEAQLKQEAPETARHVYENEVVPAMKEAAKKQQKRLDSLYIRGYPKFFNRYAADKLTDMLGAEGVRCEITLHHFNMRYSDDTDEVPTSSWYAKLDWS